MSLFSSDAIPKTVGSPLLLRDRGKRDPRRLTEDAEVSRPRRLRFLREFPKGFSGEGLSCPRLFPRHRDSHPEAAAAVSPPEIPVGLWGPARDPGCGYEGVGSGRARLTRFGTKGSAEHTPARGTRRVVRLSLCGRPTIPSRPPRRRAVGGAACLRDGRGRVDDRLTVF